MHMRTRRTQHLRGALSRCKAGLGEVVSVERTLLPSTTTTHPTRRRFLLLLLVLLLLLLVLLRRRWRHRHPLPAGLNRWGGGWGGGRGRVVVTQVEPPRGGRPRWDMLHRERARPLIGIGGTLPGRRRRRRRRPTSSSSSRSSSISRQAGVGGGSSQSTKPRAPPTCTANILFFLFFRNCLRRATILFVK